LEKRDAVARSSGICSARTIRRSQTTS
jgi:hypothetical protein